MNTDAVAAPPAVFNYAAYLRDLNRERGDKTAYIDDTGSLAYGELFARVARFAGALLDAGIRREERVLLLMHDCNDWPVAFLGAIHAGIVPVAVNTLLPVGDYLYMLQHSRAQAALVSNALLPTLREALASGDHQVGTVIVSRAEGGLQDGEQSFDAVLEAAQTLAEPAATAADETCFWLYSSGSTGKPKGTVHSHANPYWTSELYGKGVLGITESDVCFRRPSCSSPMASAMR